MFRAHTPIIRSIRCWFAAYGFLHRVCGWVVVLRAAAWVVCIRMVRTVPCTARHRPRHTHDLRSGSQDHHPSTNSVQKTICPKSTSNAPDDGRMHPKHVELRKHKINSLHEVDISYYFMRKMYGQTTLKWPFFFEAFEEINTRAI